MKCSQCAFDNPDNIRFCGECGNKLKKTCPGCGSPNPPQFKFCGNCGNSLSDVNDGIAVDYKEPHSYTPKHLADKILTTRSSIEGERKLVTVLFADIANFTSISEKLDPEEIHQIMDGCFKILMDEIHKYEGTINQFTGDGVMALFGAPVAHEDHANRSCHAALSIQNAMRDYSEKIKGETDVEFMMRIGINSGPVIVGAIGDDLRMDYTAVGDTTNLSSRMEANAKPGQILISGNTFKLVQDYFEFDGLGGIDVRGKKEPQAVYQLTKTGKVKTRIGASIAKGLTKFVGRKNSMRTLLDAFEKAKSGSGQVIGIVGEAGVGKSRLLLEMRNSLPQNQYIYLEGRCLHYGGSISYLPIIDILKSFFDITEGDREFLINKKMNEKILEFDENLKSVISPFQELLSLNIDNEAFRQIDPKEKREKTFEAIRDILIRASQDMPVIMAVEDLHWMDKTSGEFLDYLIGWIANAPFLLLLLYRPEYTHQWGSKSFYSQIGLAQLGIESSGELVKAILEGGDVASELKSLIFNRSAGNPLFMEEFAHSLLENGVIEKNGRTFVLSGKESDIRVPDTIQGIIAARLDRLEENLKRTMQVASVIGRDFAFRILQTITGMHEELKSQLLNLQGLEFIYEKQLFPDLEYIFKHALTQEVAYNSLLLDRRKKIHERIGNAIEQIYSDKIEDFFEILGHHYNRSENFQQAYHYYKLAGKKAIEKYSHWEALELFRAAIHALDQQPKGNIEIQKAQVEIRLLLHVPMRQLFYPKDSIKLLEEGASIAKNIKDEKSLIQFYSQIGRYYSMAGEPLKGQKYQEKCFQKALALEDLDLLAPVTDDLSLSCWATGEFYKFISIAPKIIRQIEEEHREADYFGRSSCIYLSAVSALGADLGATGEFEIGESWLKKGLELSSQIQHSYSTGMVELMYGAFYLHKGEGENCIVHTRNTLKHFEASQANFYIGITKGFMGFGNYLSGNYETALKLVDEGFKLHSYLKIPLCLPYFGFMAGAIHLERGELDEAYKSLKDSLHLSQKFNDRFSEGVALIYLGRAKGMKSSSNLKEAEDHILLGIRLLKGLKLKPWFSIGNLFLGEIYLNSEEKNKAIEILTQTKNSFQEMGMDRWLERTRAVMEP